MSGEIKRCVNTFYGFGAIGRRKDVWCVGECVGNTHCSGAKKDVGSDSYPMLLLN